MYFISLARTNGKACSTKGIAMPSQHILNILKHAYFWLSSHQGVTYVHFDTKETLCAGDVTDMTTFKTWPSTWYQCAHTSLNTLLLGTKHFISIPLEISVPINTSLSLHFDTTNHLSSLANVTCHTTSLPMTYFLLICYSHKLLISLVICQCVGQLMSILINTTPSLSCHTINTSLLCCYRMIRCIQQSTHCVRSDGVEYTWSKSLWSN